MAPVAMLVDGALDRMVELIKNGEFSQVNIEFNTICDDYRQLYGTIR